MKRFLVVLAIVLALQQLYFDTDCQARPRERPAPDSHISFYKVSNNFFGPSYDIYVRNSARCISYSVTIIVYNAVNVLFGGGVHMGIVPPNSTVILGDVKADDPNVDLSFDMSRADTTPFDYLCAGDDPANRIEINWNDKKNDKECRQDYSATQKRLDAEGSRLNADASSLTNQESGRDADKRRLEEIGRRQLARTREMESRARTGRISLAEAKQFQAETQRYVDEVKRFDGKWTGLPAERKRLDARTATYQANLRQFEDAKRNCKPFAPDEEPVEEPVAAQEPAPNPGDGMSRTNPNINCHISWCTPDKDKNGKPYPGPNSCDGPECQRYFPKLFK